MSLLLTTVECRVILSSLSKSISQCVSKTSAYCLLLCAFSKGMPSHLSTHLLLLQGQLHQCFLLEPSAYLGYAGLAGHGRRSSSQGKSLSIFQANAFVTPANIELAKASHVAEPTPQWAGEPDAARSRGKSQMYNSVTGGNDGLRIISNLPA